MKTKETLNEKVNKVVRLYEEIKSILPTSSIGLSIHDLDLRELDKSVWNIEVRYKPDTNAVFFSAERIMEKYTAFDVTLYSDDIELPTKAEEELNNRKE